MLLTDTVELSGTRRTRDGYLVAQVRAARTGIQTYLGSEVGRPDLAVVRVYRPPEEVFASDAMATAAHRPVTNGHPKQAVTAETWRDVSVGYTGGDVVRDGSFLQVPLLLADAAAIEDVESGRRQLSFGYTCDLDWTAGTTPEGEPHDAIQRGIRINHLSIEQRGRAGSECRIGDAGAQSTTPTPTNNQGVRAVPDDTRAVVLDGLTIRTNDAGAEAIARLQRQLSDAAGAADTLRLDHARVVQGLEGQVAAMRQQMADAEQAHQGALAAAQATHQQALDAANGRIAALEVQTTDAAMDARVTARLNLFTQARRVLGDNADFTGQTDDQIRRAVVAKALPAMALDESKGAAYVQAAFDAVMAAPIPAAQPQTPAQPDPLRLAVAAGAHTADAAPKVSAFERNRLRLENAWKHAGEKGAA